MIIYGKQLFLYVVERHPELIKTIYLVKEVEQKLFARLCRLGCEIQRVDPKRAQAMARGGNHQGVLAEVSDFEVVPLARLRDASFLVMLAGVTDVGNIGAIARTCYALEVDGLVIGGIRAPSFEGIARVSSGALFDLPVAVGADIVTVLNELRQTGFQICAASMGGVAPEALPVNAKRVLVMGSEGEGFPVRVKKMFHYEVGIAMKEGVDSLNVSVAAGILIDRMRR